MESKHRFPQALENACAFPTFPPPRLLLSSIKTKRKNSCPRTGEILDCDQVRLAAKRDPAMQQVLLGNIRNATSEGAKRVLGWSPRSGEEAVVASAEVD